MTGPRVILVIALAAACAAGCKSQPERDPPPPAAEAPPAQDRPLDPEMVPIAELGALAAAAAHALVDTSVECADYRAHVGPALAGLFVDLDTTADLRRLADAAAASARALAAAPVVDEELTRSHRELTAALTDLSEALTELAAALTADKLIDARQAGLRTENAAANLAASIERLDALCAAA